MERRTRDANAKLQLLLSVFIFGSIGIFVRFIPLPSSLIALIRGVIGTLFLLFVLLIRKQRLSLAAIKANLLLLTLSGAFIGFNWILLFEAYRYTSVATATLCYYLAPVFVTVASPFVLRERLTKAKLICVLAALIGMVFVSGVLSGARESLSLRGVAFGIGAALLYASVILMNKHLNDIASLDMTIVQLSAAALVLLPYTLLTEDVAAVRFTPMTTVLLVIVGIVHTGLAYVLYLGSIQKLRAQTVAIFSYVDPIVAILLSALLLNERLDFYGAVGAVLILGATLVSDLLDGRAERA